MTIREYVCDDCGQRKHQTGAGPRRVRCDECKRKRDAARKRRAKSTLAVVESPPIAEPPVSPPVPAAPLPTGTGPVRRAVDDVLAGLDVFGGVAPALKAMAQSLADLMDSREDLRPGASKELRAVLADLSPSREVADDAASFLAGLSSPLRNAPA